MPAAPAKFTDTMGAFFDRHPLAESATYTASGGSPATIYVHFMDAPKDLDLVRAKYAGAEAQARCKASDVPTAGRGDTLNVRSTTYQVLETEPNGAGTTMLILSSAAQHG